MSIESFFTLQSLTPGQNPAGSGSALGVPAQAGGENFFDFILNYVTETPEEQKQNEDGKLSIAKLVAASPEIAEEVEEFSIGESTDLADTLALNQRAFDDILKPVEIQKTISVNKVETPDGTKEISRVLFIDTAQNHRPVLNKVRSVAERITDFMAKDPSQLIASDLTPQDLAEIEGYVLALQNGEVPGEEPNLGLLSDLVKLLPPQARADLTSVVNANKTANDVIAQLNALLAESASKIDGAAKPTNQDGQSAKNTGGENGDFRAALQAQAGAPDEASTYRTNASVSQGPAPVPPANTNTIQSFTADAPLGILLNPDAPLSPQLGLGQPTPSVTSSANLTNPVTQSYSAGTTHPATQMVSNALQKSAQNGQNTDITLRLDPPDLGRVQARMQFGKGGLLKTTLMVEQPETYAMLQRDAQSLEKALQEMGMDLGDGLNLELAEQGFNFDQGNERGGGHEKGGTGAGGELAESEEEIINSTMTWRVDPETGHTHYNILV